MKKRFLSAVLALAMALSVTVCGAGVAFADSDSEPEYTLRFGHQLSATHPYTLAAQKFADTVEERSNGRVHIDIYPSSQLGSERELTEAVQMGTVDFALSTGPMASFDSDFYINDLPGLFKSTEHAYAVLDGEIGQELLTGLETKAGMKGLNFWETGWLCMFNNKQLIEHPEDLKGMALRTMENTTYIDYFTALDCNPVPMAYSEFMSSVQNGTINGTLSPIVTIYTDKTYEACPYITRAYQWYCTATLIMNLDLWNSMDEELQTIIQEAADEARDYERQTLADLEDEYMQELIDEGATIYDVDTEEWLALDDAISAAWSSVVPDKVPQETIDKIVAIGEDY